ncbi:monosaccharide-transporting ATPase [Spirochaetia bacterium]|nr:monosaccharide-transporting ATPase [Spirochaetia bacterium]
MTTAILSMKGIRKSFSGNEVLHSVPFDLRAGEVHTLMGENGSGKSTLMKILMGIHSPDAGVITLDGKEVNFQNPAQALANGIAMIHQELSPVMDMEISENIFIGREIRDKTGLFVDIVQARRQAAALLKSFSLPLDPSVKMRELSVGQCQLIEIIKAVSCNARIVIMDEPTSAITEKETEILFEQIKRLKNENVSIVYISHKMEEIFKISDRITVLRDGNYIGTNDAGKIDSAALIKMMVGRELTDVFPKTNVPMGDVILKVDNIKQGSKLNGVSFELRRGEILGVAGLVGAGRSELAETIFGIRKKESGTVTLNGDELHITHPKDAVKRKMAMITEDRKLTGLNLIASIVHNITIVSIKKLTRYGLLNRRLETECAKAFSKRLRINSKNLNAQAQSLSGGNQQKVVVAKWLVGNPDIIIMDEPTRGIDVGAKRDIYLLMGELAGQGKAIIMISSEMPELIGICDRIIVLSEGKLTGEFNRLEFSQEEIMWRASGITKSGIGGKNE